MTHLTEEEALNVVAYVIADVEIVDSSTWDLIITHETSKSIVHEIWQKSIFNEDQLPLDRVIAEDHCNEWLVYASYEDKIEMMRSAA